MIAGISPENEKERESVCCYALADEYAQASVCLQDRPTPSLSLSEQRVLSYISGVCESEGMVPIWAIGATHVLGGIPEDTRVEIIESLERKGAVRRVTDPDGVPCLTPTDRECIQEGEQ